MIRRALFRLHWLFWGAVAGRLVEEVEGFSDIATPLLFGPLLTLSSSYAAVVLWARATAVDYVATLALAFVALVFAIATITDGIGAAVVYYRQRTADAPLIEEVNQ